MAAEEKYAELESEQQTISTFDREADARINEKHRLHTDDIVKEIRVVVEARAKSAGYTLVLGTYGQGIGTHAPMVLYSNGQDDMTDTIIKELNVAAPADSLGTNAPAASSSTNPSTSPSPAK